MKCAVLSYLIKYDTGGCSYQVSAGSLLWVSELNAGLYKTMQEPFPNNNKNKSGLWPAVDRLAGDAGIPVLASTPLLSTAVPMPQCRVMVQGPWNLRGVEAIDTIRVHVVPRVSAGRLVIGI